MPAPVLVKPIPNQVINEQAAYGPFDLKDFIESGGTPNLSFMAELKGGGSLPTGMICTSDGILTGIPGKETQGNYEVIVSVKNDDGALETSFVLTIKPSFTVSTTEYVDKLKAQVWQALEQHLPIPELERIYERPITATDLYYLFERWSTLTLYDAFNLEPPGEKRLLTLPGASPHFNVYDRGSCLVGCPKDLFSHERTQADALQTARAMAQEVHKRGWTIEMVGLNRMSRAVWVEIQKLNDQTGKHLEIINFNPTNEDMLLYIAQAERITLKGSME